MISFLNSEAPTGQAPGLLETAALVLRTGSVPLYIPLGIEGIPPARQAAGNPSWFCWKLKPRLYLEDQQGHGKKEESEEGLDENHIYGSSEKKFPFDTEKLYPTSYIFTGWHVQCSWLARRFILTRLFSALPQFSFSQKRTDQ